MKVLIVIPSFYPAVVYGGPVFTSKHTAEELSKINISVKVATTNANMTTRLDIKKNIWHKWNDLLYVKYYNETIINKISLPLLLNLWKDIKKTDVVHIQGIFSTPTPIALIYAKLLNKDILLTPHGTLGEWCLNEGSKMKKNWLNYFIKPFNQFLTWHATAEMEKENILKVFPDAKVVVIPNGINTKEFKTFNKLKPNDFFKKFTLKKLETDKIIISMGRLQKVKGFDILINSFITVLIKYPHAKLLIAGQDEGEKQNLENQIQEHGLTESVFLIGNISGQDKIDFFTNADVFALPSHNENFGVVYAESLAAGTPIVASKHTPWEEVEKNNCGKWVDNSKEEISKAIINLLDFNRNIIRENALKYSEKFDWSNIAKTFKIEFHNLK